MKLILTQKKEETKDVTTFIFSPDEELSFIPGQFLHHVLHHRPTDDRGSDRWFTNAAAPFEKNVRITTRFASEKSSTFKTELFKLKEGDELEASVVEGDFILNDMNTAYVFIAGGIGIT